jgi:NCAIR mutase (PurE)-related protein
MTPDDLRNLLAAVRRGEVSADRAAEDIIGYWRALPFENLEYVRIDHHRGIRHGFPEVVFGPGKSPAQVAAIAERLAARGQDLLVTRTTEEVWRAVRDVVPEATFHPIARAIVRRVRSDRPGTGLVLVASAGTSDIPVAEEAALTAEVMGSHVDRLYDVGVAGLHRLLEAHGRLTAARVVVAVAGMEGALPSVVGGLVGVPVIAVPTSVGYGANLGGVAALLAMLNSCAPGVAVVNVDNGFGAGALAHRINRMGCPGEECGPRHDA